MNLHEKKDSNRLREIMDYISQFKTMQEFKASPKFRAIKLYIYKNYKDDEDYNWIKITSGLIKGTPNKEEDQVVTDKLTKMFPQWDFSNVKYEFKNGRRYLDGLYCPIKDENEIEHGVSNNLNVKDLIRRGNGCRKCGVERISQSRKIDIDKWISEFPKDKGYIFDKNKFYYREDLADKTLFVKDVVCTKHDPPFVFAKDGVNVHNLKAGKTGCPLCGKSESKGESIVKKELVNLGYKIENQKSFEGCYGFKGKRYCDLLKFDAYVKKKDGTDVCIEFDGVQHFKPIPFFGGQDALESLQERDQIKTDFCKSNGIELIRIPYWDIDKIGQILKDKLGYYDHEISEIKTRNGIIITDQQLRRLLQRI